MAHDASRASLYQTIIPNSEAFDVEIDENIELSTRDLEASVSVPNKAPGFQIFRFD